MVLLRLLSRLPLSVLYLLSDLMFFIGYRVIRYRREVVVKNLRKSFPDKTEKEIHEIEKRFYHNLCDYPVETLKMLTMSREQVMRRMKYMNPEVIENEARAGKSMIYLTSHQFNWEWLLAGVCLTTTAPLHYVYQAQSSAFFDSVINVVRQRFGAHPIRKEKVAREAIKRKGEVSGLAMLSDQFPGIDSDKRYWTSFLNQDTAFFQGINQLPVIMQCPVIFFESRKIRRGYYECRLVKIAEPPYERNDFSVVNNYVRATEKIIREQPEGWLWSHDRWKKNRAQMGDV
jgi:KDO2-lipid IV(A) lauroyltransferase